MYIRTHGETTPDIKTEDAVRLWQHLFGEERGFLHIFTALREPEGELGSIRTANFRYPELADEAAKWAGEKAVEGREVYFCSHLLIRPQRKKDQAAPVLALWGDLDGAPLPNSDLKPTAIVQSSPGHYHPYWRLTDSIPPEAAELLNKRLARKIGADPAGFDLTQLLRVPGTYNRKRAEACPVRLLEVREGEAYVPGELDARLPPPEPKPEPTASADEGDVPPVRLGEAALRRWRGEVVERKEDGELDRSASLVQIARALAWREATEPTVVAALRDRDKALGWIKAADRRDGGEKYYASIARDACAAAEKAQGSEEPAGGPRGAEIDSLGLKEGVSNELIFRTAKQIAEATPKEVPWRVKPWVADGAITEISGRIKASGKTTFALHMAAKVLRGEPFMGAPVRKSPVVFLTEQAATSFRQALEKAGLGSSEDLHVLYWQDAAAVPWPEIVAAAVAKCKDAEAKLLFVDTLGVFAKLHGDAENSAGAAQEVMAPLKAAAAEGFAVVYTRHARKGGGVVGEEGRGSSAFAGDADQLLSLRLPDGNVRETVRVIESLGRFEETPKKLMIELTESGYRSLGDAGAFAEKEAMKEIEDILPATEEHALTTDEIVDKLTPRGVKRSAITSGLKALAEAETIQYVGQGKKGDPRRYYKPPAEDRWRDEI